jgi:hypothetical protein
MLLGSVTDDHEIVNGETVLAPDAGEIKLGAGGVAAKAGTAAAMVMTKKHTNAKNERSLIAQSPNFREAEVHLAGWNVQPNTLIFFCATGCSRCSGALNVSAPEYREHY